MKNVLFATTATAALLVGGVASAQGIALFGSARLGLGYNINNEGNLVLDEDGDTEDDLRAVSRIRFGVNMTGETESGITFGGTIRADNAIGGEGDAPLSGQTGGSVFVSGSWGTLTYGDTNGADEQWVGDLNEVGLTCLGCQNETPFISNGGGFGSGGNDFASNPEARPTVRYDYDFAGFGVSLSSNRDLTDVGVGGGWTGDFGDASVSIGAGYYDFDSFTIVGDPGTTTVTLADGTEVLVPVDPVIANVPGGDQWSVALGGEFATFSGKLIYTSADAGGAAFDTGGIGLGAGFDAWIFNGYYIQVMDASGDLGPLDGLQSYGVGVNYDLGGGALVKFGVGSVWSLADADDGYTVADFGIDMAF